MVILENVPLAPHTTFRLGGSAAFFCVAESEADVVHAVEFAEEKNVPITILGGGSNILVDDAGVAGLVIQMRIPGTTYSGAVVQAGAGVVFDALIRDVVSRGLWGLENLSSIPGTVGASVIQNIGAYGVEVQQCVQEVRVYDVLLKEFLMLSNEMCDFGYRDSLFKRAGKNRYIVTQVTFLLSEASTPHITYKDLAQYFGQDDAPSLFAVRAAVAAIRADKFPDLTVIGTAGSFFKNPVISDAHFAKLQEQYPDMPSFPQEQGVKIPLAWVLDKVLSLRGARLGAVAAYEKQPLVLVNYGGAMKKEVDAFADHIAQNVFEVTGIHIEREVQSIS